jgi:tetratricopeptide (TPR) repeat protein
VLADLGRALAGTADEHDRAGRLKEAEAALVEARDRLQKLADAKAVGVTDRKTLGEVYTRLGTLLRRTGRPKEGAAALLKALETLTTGVNPKSPPTAFRVPLRQALRELARELAAKGRIGEAIALLVYAVELSAGAERAEFLAEIAEVMSQKSTPKLTAGAATEAATKPEAMVAVFAETPLHADPKLDVDDVRVFAVALYARAVAAVLDDPDTPADDRPKKADEYAAKAVEVLKAAAGAGYFERPGTLRHLHEEPRFAALRGRPPVRDFLVGLKDQ